MWAWWWWVVGCGGFQGFTEEITLDKKRWVGVIKDYDAGTPMECVISPLIRYLDLPVIIKRQREVSYHPFLFWRSPTTPSTQLLACRARPTHLRHTTRTRHAHCVLSPGGAECDQEHQQPV